MERDPQDSPITSQVVGTRISIMSILGSNKVRGERAFTVLHRIARGDYDERGASEPPRQSSLNLQWVRSHLRFD